MPLPEDVVLFMVTNLLPSFSWCIHPQLPQVRGLVWRLCSSSSKSNSSQWLVVTRRDGWERLQDQALEGRPDHEIAKRCDLMPRMARSIFGCSESTRLDRQRCLLVKFCVHCMDGGRGRRFREDLQASSAFSMFNKHVAAELIKPEVLATNTDLAHELTSWVEECATKREGPKGLPLMNLIISYYETGTDSSVALSQMHLFSPVELQIAQGGWGLREEDQLCAAWAEAGRQTLCVVVASSEEGAHVEPRDGENQKQQEQFQEENLWLALGTDWEEFRERRHVSNFENVSKGLQSTPPTQLALPAADAEQKGTKTPKGHKKSGGGAPQKPAAPGQVEPGTASKHKAPCALHAAGHCRFGEKCRNHHSGEPGSDAARKAYADFQKTKGQGGDKPNKGKGKGKNEGKNKGKNDNKQSKGAAATTPAAVAAAASTVTITEVDGQKVMAAWKGFCEFCSKAPRDWSRSFATLDQLFTKPCEICNGWWASDVTWRVEIVCQTCGRFEASFTWKLIVL